MHPLIRRQEKAPERRVARSPLSDTDVGDVGGADTIQRASDTANSGPALTEQPGSGQPLAAEVRSLLEPRFGFSFGSIRVHADDAAAESARAVNARAYTIGDDIVFGAGQYAPQSDTGRVLLAHELAHVIQNQRAPAAPARPISDPGDAAEVEASAAALQVTDPAAPETAPTIAAAPAARIQRDGPTPVTTTTTPPPATPDNAPAQNGPPANAPGMSEEDARRLLYAQTTLKQIPPLEAKDKETLQQATKDAAVFSFIQDRDEKRKELTEATKQYEEFTANLQDKAGPPTAADAGQKDDLKHRVDKLTEEVNNLDTLIKPILASLHVTEDQLVTLVSETFPAMFVARGKQIAMQQLQTNQDMAERERAKYQDVAGAGDIGRPKIDGLRNAAKDLSARQKAIDEQKLKIQSAHQDMPPGGAPDPAQQGSSAYDLAHEDELRADIEKKQEELAKTRQSYGRDYQILFREDVDVDQLAVANDDQLRQIVGGKVDDIIENITKTKKNIQEDKVKIWNLQDIVGMTVQDLAIGNNPTLISVVNKRRDRDAADAQSDEDLENAVKALVLTAATIASIATLNPGPMLVAGLVVGTVDVIERGSQAARVSAAKDVALDPTVAQMSTEDPEWIWLIVGIAGLLLDAVSGAALLRQTFKALKAAATTLESFAAAARRAFPEKEAERLIEIARQELKAGLNLTEEITAIGGAFADSERVRIGLALTKYMNETYTAAYLQLSSTAERRIITMSEESIRAAYGARAEQMLARHPPGRSGGFYDKGLNRGTAFVKDQASVLEVGESVAHEMTHGFQKSTGILESLRVPLKNMEFYEEMQAFKMQQSYVQKAAAEYGEAALPENSRWLVKATDQEIGAEVTKRYRVSPDPEVGITAPITDELIGKMLDRTTRGIDMRRDLMNRLEQSLPNE